MAFKGGGYGFGAAYNYAKKLTFNGLKGYLATITTEEEEAVLDSISSQSGWAGAVDLKSIKAPDSDTYDGCGITVTYSPAVGADRTADTCETNKNNFKWICGPEATIDNGTMNTYSKGRWDGTELVKQPSGWGGNSAEYLLGIHFAKGWNDYPGDGSALTAGYFVEFSAYGDYGKTVTSESYSSSIDTDNWGAWSMTAANESSWSVQGKATRTSTTSPSVTDNWTTVPVLPQQPTKAQEAQKIGDFWTESSFTEPTANNEGSVTFTATGSHVGETGTTISTNYTFSITKTLMKLAAVSVPTASSTETVLSNLTAKAYYKIATSDGTEVVLQADADGNIVLSNNETLLGKTLSGMTMVDSTGTTILSETQALSGSVKQKYSTPDPTIVYGDNDLLTLTGLIKGHTYTINGNDYVADENGVVTLPSSLISDTAATQLSIVDKSLDTTRYISSDAKTSLSVAARGDAPKATEYPVTEASSASGKATVKVKAGSEYKDPTTGEWVKCTADTDVPVTPGTSLTVRISATSTAPASKETTVATSKYKQPTPAPEINYDTGSFTHLIPNASYIIDGRTYTADGKGNLTIDVPLYGKTFSFIKAHVNSDGSDEDSAAVSVTVAAIPDAPSAADYPVTEATSSDEKATVSVPSGSEYKDPTTGEWVKCTADTDVPVTPGTSLTVRISATSTAPASKETSIPTKIYQEPTPEGTASYTDGKLTGFVPNATYTINGTTYTADADGNIPLDENWYGTSLSVVRVHVNSDGSDADSTPETINVSSRPAAPTNEEVKATQESDGTESITVSETQEYSVDGGVTWIKGENNTVSVSGDKKVMVRTAATANAPAGEITTISVDPFYPYKTPAAIASYAGGFLLLLAIIYRSIIYFAWHNKDKHNHLGFFVANNRWINVLLFHTPYNKVELQAQEDAKQAEEDKKEGK